MKFKTFICLLLIPPVLYSQDFGWQLKKEGYVTGYPLFVDVNNETVFYGLDSFIYKSDLNCDFLTPFGNYIPGIDQIKVLFRSGLRPNEFVVATQNTSTNSAHIFKSNDNCQTWNLIGNYEFAFFGIPVTQDYNNPDLLYTIDGNTFLKSTDFGSTWIEVSTDLSFGTPCDIEVFKDNPSIILVGDDSNGIFRSSDNGENWTQTFSTSGEVPTIHIQKTDPDVAFATNWGGTGGVYKSTNHGLTWEQISGPVFNNNLMWGIDIFEHDTSFIAAGEFSTEADIFISSDYGNNWVTVSNFMQPNFALKFIKDSILVAASRDGIFKLRELPITNETSIKLIFSVDINDAVDFNTNIRIDTMATGVWLKGGIESLGNNQGNWTFQDTLNGTLLPLQDNGTGYDSIANDNIWTLEIDLPPGENQIGNFTYRYGISYPGVDTVNNGIEYLNNDHPDSSYNFNLQETQSVFILPQNQWHYKIKPVLAFSDSNITVNLDLNESYNYPFFISNKLGTDTLYYKLTLVTDSIVNQIIGIDSFQNSFDNKLIGNIYFTNRPMMLEHFEQFLNLSANSIIRFVVFESNNTDLTFRKIYDGVTLTTAGTGFASSNPINKILLPDNYYLIGIISPANVTGYWSNFTGNNNLIGNQIGKVIVDAPPSSQDSLTIVEVDSSIFYQNVFVSSKASWVNPVIVNGDLLPGQINSFDFMFNSFNNSEGIYKATIFGSSNDYNHNSFTIPVKLTIKDPLYTEDITNSEFNFFLNQNYPNPFNPTTTITFSLPGSTDYQSVPVKIIVYDILGREVTTLVNEVKQPGVYEVQFDASGLSSGIYFYKLTSGKNISTKKMILLR